MVFGKRTVVVPTIFSAVFLTACSEVSDPVITRAWQIDHILNEPKRDCSFELLSNSLERTIRETADGDRLLRDLDDACPGLSLAGEADSDRKVTLAAAAVPATSTDTSDTGAETGGSGTDGSDDGASGTDGGGTDGSGADTDGTDGAGTDGSDTSGGDRGKNGNNGGGNGSEGGSPGKGKGANQDE